MRHAFVAVCIAAAVAAPAGAQMPSPEDWGIEIWTPVEFEPDAYARDGALGGFTEGYDYLSIEPVRLAEGEHAGADHLLGYVDAELTGADSEREVIEETHGSWPAVTVVAWDEWADIVVREVDLGGGVVLRIRAESEIDAEEARAVLETVQILDPELVRAAARLETP